jgi:formylglycine-generating enzyme required for sulfatase activity
MTAAQTALAAQLGIPSILVDGQGMRLALIPAGELLMGSPEDEQGRYPDETLHRVRITRPFYLGIYEVTQREYLKVVGKNPSRFVTPDRPVEQVSWEDAVEFCRRRSQEEGVNYRLPTEAEWEYACRAGTTTRTYLGQSIGRGNANIVSGRTEPVGQHRPNPFGLYDMHGNVYEWCADWYAADYPLSPVENPKGPEKGEQRVLRGAGWFDGPGTKESTDRRIRSAYRAGAMNIGRSNRTGFRVLREIETPTVPRSESSCKKCLTSWL